MQNILLRIHLDSWIYDKKLLKIRTCFGLVLYWLILFLFDYIYKCELLKPLKPVSIYGRCFRSKTSTPSRQTRRFWYLLLKSIKLRITIHGGNPEGLPPPFQHTNCLPSYSMNHPCMSRKRPVFPNYKLWTERQLVLYRAVCTYHLSHSTIILQNIGKAWKSNNVSTTNTTQSLCNAILNDSQSLGCITHLYVKPGKFL